MEREDVFLIGRCSIDHPIPFNAVQRLLLFREARNYVSALREHKDGESGLVRDWLDIHGQERNIPGSIVNKVKCVILDFSYIDKLLTEMAKWQLTRLKDSKRDKLIIIIPSGYGYRENEQRVLNEAWRLVPSIKAESIFVYAEEAADIPDYFFAPDVSSSIKLFSFHADGAFGQPIFDIIANWQGLEYLELKATNPISGNQWSSLEPTLRKMPRLRVLVLVLVDEDLHKSNKMMNAATQALPVLTQLKHLTISGFMEGYIIDKFLTYAGRIESKLLSLVIEISIDSQTSPNSRSLQAMTREPLPLKLLSLCRTKTANSTLIANIIGRSRSLHTLNISAIESPALLQAIYLGCPHFANLIVPAMARATVLSLCEGDARFEEWLVSKMRYKGMENVLQENPSLRTLGL